MDDNLEIRTLRVCRTCMEEIENVPFFHLDSTQVNTELTIGQKLSNFTPELDLNIAKNTIICGTCADTINFVYNFKIKCIRSELQIHKYIQQLQHTGDVDITEVAKFNQLRCGDLSIEFKMEDTEVTGIFKYQEAPTLLSNDTVFNDGDNDNESINNQYLLTLQEVDIECVLFNTGDGLFNYGNPETEEDCNTYDNSNIHQDCITTQIVDEQNVNVQDLGTTDTIYECYTCGHKTESKFKLILHMKYHTGKKWHQKKITCGNRAKKYNALFSRFRCCVCNYLTKYKWVLSFHIRTHLTKKQILNQKHIKKNQSSIAFKKMKKYADGKRDGPNYNKSVLKSRSDLMLKYLKSKRQISQPDNLNSNVEAHIANKPFKCSVCNYNCNYRSHLKQHILIHTGEKPFKCSVCEYQCKQKSNLKRHMQIHTGYKPYRCSVCEYQFIEKSYLKRHMQSHTGNKPFRCSVCEYQLTRKYDLKKHMLIHTGEKPLKCYVCEYQCIQKGNLQTHMQIHTGDKPFKCSICEYRCSKKTSLKIHMPIHTGEKPFKCNVCEYQCIQKNHFKTHMLIHTGEKPFKCNVCEYQCIQKNQLKTHMQIHTGDKPFKCSFCEYRCSKKTHLKIHMPIHTGEKPFKCSVCEYRSRWQTDLKNHMLIHTGEKPFKCSVCEYQSIRKSDLKRHIKIHS